MTFNPFLEVINLSDCLQCGTCCKVINIGNSFKEIEETVEKEFPNGLKGEDRFKSDFTFIYSFWRKLSKGEVLKLKPSLVGKWKEDREYFTCTLQKDNKCSVHDRRPAVCRDHPWYGLPHTLDYGFFSDECGYKLALEKELFDKQKEGILNPNFNAKIPSNLISSK